LHSYESPPSIGHSLSDSQTTNRPSTLEYPGLFDSVTVWAVADDDGMGNGVLNECVEDNNSSPMDQVCIPPG
jgi:hypothetical protein